MRHTEAMDVLRTPDEAFVALPGFPYSAHYAELPDGFVLPPDLAPLAYECGPELAKLIARFLRPGAS